MIIFKALLILFANVCLSYLFVKIIYLFLFFPKNAKYVFGKKVFLAPGYVFRKKDFLEKKVAYLIKEYVKSDKNKKIYIEKIQNKCTIYLEEKLNTKNKNRFIAFFWEKLKNFGIILTQKLISMFFKTFIPFVIKKYSLERYVEIITLKIEIFLMKDYLEKYFFRYLIYFFSALGFLVGLINAIFYLLINCF